MQIRANVIAIAEVQPFHFRFPTIAAIAVRVKNSAAISHSHLLIMSLHVQAKVMPPTNGSKNFSKGILRPIASGSGGVEEGISVIVNGQVLDCFMIKSAKQNESLKAFILYCRAAAYLIKR